MNLPNPSPTQINEIMSRLEDRGSIGAILWGNLLAKQRAGLIELVKRIIQKDGEEMASIAVLILWVIEEALESQEEIAWPS